MFRRKVHRRENGNTLYFATAVTFLLIFSFVVASTIFGLAILHAHLTDRLEKISLTAARLLNAYDAAGQINNISAASRQLVFDSRSYYNETSSTHPELAPLAASLLKESREGAQFVAQERDKLNNVTLDKVKALIQDEISGRQQKGETFAVPWLVSGPMQVDIARVGYADGCDSNVESPSGYQALLDMDKALINLDTSFYRANINLALPAQDADLAFKISALPGPIQGTISPLRLIKNESFRPVAAIIRPDDTVGAVSNGFAPSAFQLHGHYTVTCTLANISGEMAETKSSLTSGASPMP